MIVTGRRVVVTGKIPNESRETAQQKLREAGAIVQDKVGKDTDILVTGANVGMTKINAAKNRVPKPVEIIPWEQAFGDGADNYAAPPPRAPMPKVRQWAPMKCSPADEIPTGDGWLFEIKYDGQRGLPTLDNGAVAIQSNTGITDLTERYPYITNDLAKINERCVLDGELVDLDGSGHRFVAFDLLEHNGVPCVAMTLDNRRKLLAKILKPYEKVLVHVGMSPAFDDGETLLDWVNDDGGEGIVAKRISSPYVEGSRGPNWLKIKLRREQEFVIAGYTPGEGSRASTFGALILGYYQDDVLTYAGKVGTGFDGKKLTQIIKLMDPLARVNIHSGFPKEKGAVYIEPGLICNVAFQKWTEDNILWHPSFQRVRDDKLAKDVVRET